MFCAEVCSELRLACLLLLGCFPSANRQSYFYFFQAVKAMRFEPDAHKKLVEDADARKERLAQEQELAKAMQEEEDEDAF